jgi:predicted RecA/RadA family phage recombinase
MGASFVQRGDSIDYTPTATISAGDVVVLGEMVAVAKLDIAANTLGALAVTGVFNFPKATTAGSALTTGTKVYWNATTKVITSDSATGANKFAGMVVADAAATATVVRVRLG